MLIDLDECINREMCKSRQGPEEEDSNVRPHSIPYNILVEIMLNTEIEYTTLRELAHVTSNLTNSPMSLKTQVEIIYLNGT